MWKNKILTLEHLKKQKCNHLPTVTYVMCHGGIESVDHMFLQCSFAKNIWEYFVSLFQLPEPPQTLCQIWGLWLSLMRPASEIFGDLIVKAIIWNIWFARNDHIFNAIVLLALSIVLKSNYMILSWLSVADEGIVAARS